MWDMIYPIVIVVAANTVYNICAKSTPTEANAFGSLTVTYIIATLISAIAFLCTTGVKNVQAELSKINLSAILLGVSIVALEFGYILIYRVGWKISLASLTANISLAVVLLLVGVLFYKDAISGYQVAGALLCSAGLFLLSK